MARVVRFVLIVGMWAVLAGVGASPAGAHAEVRESTPPADGEATEGIDEVVLSMLFFDASEPVSVEVLDERGRDHATGDPVVVARDSTITQATEPLTPGDYRIHWHAIADDGDGLSEGDIAFAVVEARDDSGNLVLLWLFAAIIPVLFGVRALRNRSDG